MKSKIMYMESGGVLAGDGGRIGQVHFSKSGRTLRYPELSVGGSARAGTNRGGTGAGR